MSFSRSCSSRSKIPFTIRFYDPDTPPALAGDTYGRTLEDILSWSDIELERSHNYIQVLFPLPEGSMFNWEAPIITREVMEAFRSRSELRSRLRLSFERMLAFYGFEISTKPEEEREGGGREHDGRLAIESDSQPSVSQESETETSTGNTGTSTGDEGQQPPVITSLPEDERRRPIVQIKHDVSSRSTMATKLESAGYYVVRGLHWRKAFRNWAVRFDHNHLRITRILRCLRVLGLETESDAFFEALQRVFDRLDVQISKQSMMFWHRAVTQPLHIAPDGDMCNWLKMWEKEQGTLVSK